jgi:succinate dehydrogenase / fumarate reductase cytochrome b subunit
MSHSQVKSFTTVFKKLFIALSGLGLVGFVLIHLLGNLTLLRPNGLAFNAYAAKLESFGPLLTLAEIGLLGVFLLHIGTVLTTKKKNLEARPVSYRRWQSKGGDTPSNLSSRTMAVSGSVILIFVILHVWQFRFGPGMSQGYVTTHNQEQIRDVYRLVVETLKNPWMAVFYSVVMVLLGLHLRHGVWSALQSLGLTRPATTRALRWAGSILGVLLGVGFLLIPAWIYFWASI